MRDRSRPADGDRAAGGSVDKPSHSAHTDVLNLVIGNNRVACEAAAAEARRRGYDVRLLEPESPTTPAEDVGRQLGRRIAATGTNPATARASTDRTCLISGGEPVVRLVDAAQRGLGGRNQQLVLAALQHVLTDRAHRRRCTACCSPAAPMAKTARPMPPAPSSMRSLVQRVRQLQLDPADFLHATTRIISLRPPTVCSRPARPTPTSATCACAIVEWATSRTGK